MKTFESKIETPTTDFLDELPDNPPTPPRDTDHESKSPPPLSDSVVDEKPKPRRRAGKPFQPIPEFAHLPPDQLEYIHDLLHNLSYEDAQREIWSTVGCRISTNRLQRYREKIDLAAALEIALQDTLPAVDQLQNLLAGRPTDIPAAGILLIQQRALALAASPYTSPTQLKDLFRIFTYQDRKNDAAHRRQIAEQREATRKQTADDRRAMNEHRKAMDQSRLDLGTQRAQSGPANSANQKPTAPDNSHPKGSTGVSPVPTGVPPVTSIASATSPIPPDAPPLVASESQSIPSVPPTIEPTESAAPPTVLPIVSSYDSFAPSFSSHGADCSLNIH